MRIAKGGDVLSWAGCEGCFGEGGDSQKCKGGRPA